MNFFLLFFYIFFLLLFFLFVSLLSWYVFDFANLLHLQFSLIQYLGPFCLILKVPNNIVKFKLALIFNLKLLSFLLSILHRAKINIFHWCYCIYRVHCFNLICNINLLKYLRWLCLYNLNYYVALIIWCF